MDPAARRPIPEPRPRHLELLGQGLHMPFVRAKKGRVVPLVGKPAKKQEITDHFGAEAPPITEGSVSFGIQRRGDPFGRLPRLAQRDYAAQDLLEVAPLPVGGHRPGEGMAALVTAGPVDRRFGALTVALGADHDALDQATDDRLAVRVRRPRRMPQPRDVRSQRGDARLVGRAQLRYRLPAPALVFFLELTLLAQAVLPLAFQRCR